MQSYYRSREGVVTGPFDAGTLLSIWQAGDLTNADFFCEAGGTQWREGREFVAELRALPAVGPWAPPGLGHPYASEPQSPRQQVQVRPQSRRGRQFKQKPEYIRSEGWWGSLSFFWKLRIIFVGFCVMVRIVTALGHAFSARTMGAHEAAYAPSGAYESTAVSSVEKAVSAEIRAKRPSALLQFSGWDKRMEGGGNLFTCAVQVVADGGLAEMQRWMAYVDSTGSVYYVKRL